MSHEHDPFQSVDISDLVESDQPTGFTPKDLRTRTGEAIEGFYSRYPYLGRPVNEDDFKRAEEFRVSMEERAQDKAGQALHDFYNRHPWL